MYSAFFVILIDIVGFSMMVPLFAYYPMKLGASPAIIGLLMAIYPMAIFLTTPFLGRMSDFYGRRPILIISMAGSVVSYLMLANANSLLLIGLARFFGGVMAGNIAAAQAYMTDISSEENRAKAMGLIGAAFGLGFIIGPLLSSWMAGDSFKDADLVLPAYVAAGLSAIALLGVLFFLPESLSKAHREELKSKVRETRIKEFYRVLKHPDIRRIACIGLLIQLCGGLFETFFPVWVSDMGTGLVQGPRGLIPFLMASGVAVVIVQGGLVGPMTKKFGEHYLLKANATLYIVSVFGITIAADFKNITLAYFFMAFVFAGSAFLNTCTQSLVSKKALTTQRGITMGVFTAVGTLGRTLGTLVTGLLMQVFGVHTPYYMAAFVMIVVLILVFDMQRQREKINIEERTIQSSA
jgi:MFS family permease